MVPNLKCRLAIWARRDGVRWPEAIYHHHKEVTMPMVPTIINHLVWAIPIPFPPTTTGITILSKTCARCVTPNENKWLKLFWFCAIIFSQNTGNDNWNGFGNDDYEKPAPDSYQTVNSSSKVSSTASRNTASLSAKQQQSNDFSSLDVKASKPKIASNKTKSVEDDAWNLLNN